MMRFRRLICSCLWNLSWPRHITRDLIALAHSTVGAWPSLRSDRHIALTSEWTDYIVFSGENELIESQIGPDIAENLSWNVVPIAEMSLFAPAFDDNPRNCQLT